jgi:hypothetical protein
MTLDRRTIRILDAALVVWVAAWIVFGVAISREVHGLTKLSDTVVKAGTALERTGSALGGLRSLPVVGGRIGTVEDQARVAARSARASGRSSRKNIEDLSLLLGLAVAIVPSLPALFVYVPFRLARAREARALQQAVSGSADDPALWEFLARRAVDNLPYDRLRQVSPNPWRDLEEGRFEALAVLELARLGFQPITRGAARV